MKSTAALFKLKRIRIFHRSLRRKVDPNVSSRLNTSKKSATGSAEIDEVSDGGLIEIYTLSHLFWNASWPIQYFTIERTNDTMTSHRKMTASVAKLSSKIAFFFPNFLYYICSNFFEYFSQFEQNPIPVPRTDSRSSQSDHNQRNSTPIQRTKSRFSQGDRAQKQSHG